MKGSVAFAASILLLLYIIAVVSRNTSAQSEKNSFAQSKPTLKKLFGYVEERKM